MTLTLNRLHFGYQQKPVFNDISFTIPKGKLVGIVGPNGGGKSTLLKLLAGQEQPQSGEILLKGKPITKPGPDRMMVFQEFDQLMPWNFKS